MLKDGSAGASPSPSLRSEFETPPMTLTRIAEILKNGQPGQSLEVAGWVRTRRDSKQGFSFIELNDGSCLSNLQVVVGADVPDAAETIKHVTTGASVRIAGELKES